MNRRDPIWRRLSALALCTVITALSATIPILDVIVGDLRPAVETHHHPGTHGFPHNHSICIQQEANQWVPVCDAPPPLVVASVALPAVPAFTPPIHSDLIWLPDSRAPPTV